MKSNPKKQHGEGVNFNGADKCKGLTEKRQRIFELLQNAECPLSAYELTDVYNTHHEPPIKAMSVYRILDYLTSIHLVHRLHSANKFMVCSNQHGCDGHELSLFLICSVCHKVEESVIAGKLDTLLSNSCKKTDFQIHGSQLEINGVCGQCQNRQIQQNRGKRINESTTD